MTTLETVTGLFVNLEYPEPSMICIDDIAWGLSRLPRFCGQTITNIPYNVAQHSIFVSEEVHRLRSSQPQDLMDTMEELVGPEATLKALLHDAAEAYTGDWPSPIKRIPSLTPIIAGIEANLTQVIFEALGLTPMTDDEKRIIKYADRIAQKIEAYNFMVSRGKDWPNMPDVSLERLQEFSPPMASLDSYKKFMGHFEYLKDCL